MQAVLEQSAVGQMGEGIVVSQPMDALLTGLAFADVAEEAHVTGQITLIVEYGGYSDPGRVMLATAPLKPDFTLPTAVLVQLFEDVLQVRLLLFIDR